jgi:hypothetical protein
MREVQVVASITADPAQWFPRCRFHIRNDN